MKHYAAEREFENEMNGNSELANAVRVLQLSEEKQRKARVWDSLSSCVTRRTSALSLIAQATTRLLRAEKGHSEEYHAALGVRPS